MDMSIELKMTGGMDVSIVKGAATGSRSIRSFDSFDVFFPGMMISVSTAVLLLFKRLFNLL